MVTTSEDQRKAVVKKLMDFCQRYHHGYWQGPNWAPPERAAELAAQRGEAPGPPRWELWLEKPGVPHSKTGETGAPLRASISFDEADLVNNSVEYLAEKLTAAVAGMEAHEALEFARFDGEYAVNPHGSSAKLKQQGEWVAEYLMTAATRV